ncbi:MAG: restriction endonuclease subunit S [Bacteroidia bacterium]
MKDWTEDNIGNLVDVNAKTAGRSFAYENIEYIDTSSVTDGIFDVPQIIEFKNAPSRAKRIVINNDIIISTVRPNLKHFGFIKNPKPNTIVSTGYAVISSKKIDAKFLYYYLASDFVTNYLSLISENQTSAYPSFNPELIKKLKIQYPEKPETQQRIASILSAYDDLIEVNNQRIKLLEQTARELYKEWFVRMRFPGYKQAKFKKGIPEKWKTIAISDMVDFKMGQSPKSEFYNEDGIGLPFHQGVGNYGLRFPEHKVFCSVNGRIANEGDVLFSVRAPVGRLNIADRKIIIGRGLAALRHKKGLNNYLFYLLQNEFSKEDLIGNGSIFNSVGKDELKKFKIFDVGDLAKQFNDFVEPIDKQLLNLIHQNTQLRQIRDRLLPRLISGKLKVSEL